MLFVVALAAGTARAQSPPEKPGAPVAFSIEGTYVEACTCRSSCAAEISGEATGCDAVGAFQIDAGTCDGQDLAGTRVAFAEKGDAVHLYLDAGSAAAKRAALEKVSRAVLAAMGTVKFVAAATIEFTGSSGAYTVNVDGGKILALRTEPVMGGDHKTPVAIANTQNAWCPTLYQGHCVSATFADGADKFTIEKGRNSFFDPHLKASRKP